MASGKSFKESYGVTSTFTGGFIAPEELVIVGLDIPAEDWNQDVHDEARLTYSVDSITDAGIEAMIRFGCVDEVKVVKRRDMLLVVDGRRKVMTARKANERLAAGKSTNRIQVPIIPDKGDSQAVTMRLGNAARLDDPPWAKAEQAAHLVRLGECTRENVHLAMVVDPVTARNWFYYLDLIPEIKDLIKSNKVPHAIGIEIGKLGKGEKTRQTLALAALQAAQANLRGEEGKTNARAVVKAILDGKLTKVSDVLQGGTTTQPPTPPDLSSIKTDVNNVSKQLDNVLDKVLGPKTPEPKESKPKVPSRGGGLQVLTQVKLSPEKIRRVTAALEPDQSGDYEGFADEAEMIAYRVMAVVTGRDPHAEGLARWPSIMRAFKAVVPSSKAQTP